MNAGIGLLARRLAFGHARRHPAEVAFMLLGIVLGAAVVVGIDTAVDACLRGFASSVRDLAGESTHRIVAVSGVMRDDDYLDLRRTRSDLPLSPVIDRRVGIAAASQLTGRLIGVDVFTYRSLESIETVGDQLSDDEYRAFQTTRGSVLLVEPLARRLGVQVGDRLRIEGGAVTTDAYCAGIVRLDPPASASAPDLIIADIATAQEVTGLLGRLDRIETRAGSQEELDRIESALPDHLRLKSTGQAAAKLEELIAAYRMNLLALSLMAAFVAVFIVYNATLVGVHSRAATIGVLRCIGISRWQLTVVFAGEALLLGTVGAVVGIAGGFALASFFVQLISTTISDLYAAAPPAPLALSGTAAFKGAAVAIGSALCGAAVPIVSALRVPPIGIAAPSVTADRSSRWARVLLAGGAASGALSIACVWLPGRTIVAGYAVAGFAWIAFALAAPGLTGVVARAAFRLSRWIPGGRALPVALAASDIRRSLGVSGIAVSAMMLAMAMNIAILTTVGSFRSGVLEWIDSRYRSDLYLAPRLAVEEGIATPLPSEVAAAYMSHPDVAAAIPYRHVEAVAAGRDVWLTATDLSRTLEDDLLPLSGRSLQRPLHPAGEVYISLPLASKVDLRAGDSIELLTPSGRWSPTVRGVYHDFVADRGTVLVDRSVFLDRWGDAVLNAVHINLRDGTDSAEVRARWLAELGPESSVVIDDHRDIRAQTRVIFDRTFRVTDAIAWMSGVVALCGLSGALLASAASRRSEHAVLRTLGAGPRQLTVRLAAEAIILSSVAVSVAIIAGTVLGEILAGIIQKRSFGWAIDTVPQPTSWVQAAAFAAVGAMIAAILPVRALLRISPSEGLRHD